MDKPVVGKDPFRNSAQYKESEECLPIEDSDTIWRYMEYYKFQSLLKEKALYFTRIGDFPDKNEGKIAKENLELYIFHSDPAIDDDEHNNTRKLKQEAVEGIMRMIYVNCFSIGPTDSQEMWERYDNDKEVVAIKSTFSRVKESLTYLNGDRKIFSEVNISKVRYIDYSCHPMKEWSVLFPFIYKKNEFEYEKELRLLATYPDLVKVANQCSADLLEKHECSGIAEYLHLDELPDYPAILISVDPKILIDQVIVHPRSSNDFIEKVKRECSEFGLRIDVERSSLNEIGGGNS